MRVTALQIALVFFPTEINKQNKKNKAQSKNLSGEKTHNVKCMYQTSNKQIWTLFLSH